MTNGVDPVVQRRRLRAEIRKLRQDTKLTQSEVARAMDWSPSKIIRIESGAVGVSVTDLRALLQYYGVKDKRRVDALIEIVRASKGPSWTDYQGRLSHEYLIYLGYESSAWINRSFEPLVVPGLLQTEEYARAMMSRGVGIDEDRIDSLWMVRERRQEMHDRETPPQMFFIVDEAVIRRVVGGPGIMRRQLERIREFCGLDHVHLQIVPFDRGAYAGLFGAFILLEFADPHDDDVLYIEHALGQATIREDTEQISLHTNAFFELEEIALSVEESLAMIDSAIADLTATEAGSRAVAAVEA